ncbi:hypothetical protein MMC17_005046 [Xylographa soralifera]|nr:hypothetical protein [Xylographa soralifera]
MHFNIIVLSCALAAQALAISYSDIDEAIIRADYNLYKRGSLPNYIDWASVYKREVDAFNAISPRTTDGKALLTACQTLVTNNRQMDVVKKNVAQGNIMVKKVCQAGSSRPPAKGTPPTQTTRSDVVKGCTSLIAAQKAKDPDQIATVSDDLVGKACGS